MAWLSDATHATPDRVPTRGTSPYLNDCGGWSAQIVSNFETLASGNVESTIICDKNTDLHLAEWAWTGYYTIWPGIRQECWGRTSGTGVLSDGGIGRFGLNEDPASWVNDGKVDCSNLLHLYCVEK